MEACVGGSIRFRPLIEFLCNVLQYSIRPGCDYLSRLKHFKTSVVVPLAFGPSGCSTIPPNKNSRNMSSSNKISQYSICKKYIAITHYMSKSITIWKLVIPRKKKIDVRCQFFSTPPSQSILKVFASSHKPIKPTPNAPRTNHSNQYHERRPKHQRLFSGTSILQDGMRLLRK